MSSGALVGTKGVPRPEREQQIIAAAVDEFAARGYAAASMVVIARRAGISKPLIYQYFGSKDGLYLTCLHSVAGGLLDRLEVAELSVDDSVASRIHALQAVFEALEPQPSAWQLLYDTTKPSDGPIAAAAQDYQRRTAALAASGSERFLRARGLTDSLDASALTAVWMGLVDSLVLWWLHHPQETAADMVQRCYRLISAVTAG
ncbi:MAG TPA: TetR/AcrR family transcriptional regulator [Jatrophihabitantaceae bacterium]|jgi:AcrR family transcriptional regulator|nr:TetR/AcrR family transcriptional regulator [Jatrophihabitantaceae bacterium]